MATLDDFQASLDALEPNHAFPPAVRGLWWAGKGDWNQAHLLVQDDPGRDAAWVHAYLHRLEGDLGNAAYWYRRAGRPAAACSLEEEWRLIATALLSESET